MELTTAQRRDLRARAHSLHAVVSISQQGLSETVLAEIDRCLNAHELIKVRVYGAERDTRNAFLTDICTRLEAAPVQHIGNLLVIFRVHPDLKKPAPAPKAASKSAPRAETKAGTKKATKLATKLVTKLPTKAGIKARIRPAPARSLKSTKSARPTDPRRRSRI